MMAHAASLPMVPRPKASSRPADAILATVGEIDVPAAAQEHRFAIEAMANAVIRGRDDDETARVIGTANTRRVELYGWGANVGRHVDATGYMYLVPLQLDRSTLYVQLGRTLVEHQLAVGQVVRLWDHAEHWTEDRGPVVAAFVGSFAAPQDELAMQLLTAGVQALAAGGYYDAPGVREGFQALLADECIATIDWATTETVLLADAEKRGMSVLRCAACDRPAVRLDDKWPYFSDRTVCRQHLGAQA